MKAIARRLGCSVREAERFLGKVRGITQVSLLYDPHRRGYYCATDGQAAAAATPTTAGSAEVDAATAETAAAHEPRGVARPPLPAAEAVRVDDPDVVDWATVPRPSPLTAWMQVFASVGVDVGSAWIKVVQVVRSKRRGPVIVNLGLCPTPAGAVSPEGIHSGAVGAALRELLRQRNIVPWQALTVVGGERLATARLDLPVVPMSELRGIMRYEAQHHLPFSPEEAVVDYVVLPDASETGGDPIQATRVFLAGARRQVVEAYEAALRTARLEPRAIDIEPLATHRALRQARGWSDSPWRSSEIVLNLGWSSTSVSVFYRGSLEGYETHQVGGDAFTSALVSQLRLTRVRAERLKRNCGVRQEGGRVTQALRPVLLDLLHGVGQTLGMYLRRQTAHPVRHIHLVGGLARLPGLPEAVAEFVPRVPGSGPSVRRLKVEIADPLSLVAVNRRLAGRSSLIGPEFTTALGAAITGGESLHEL